MFVTQTDAVVVKAALWVKAAQTAPCRGRWSAPGRCRRPAACPPSTHTDRPGSQAPRWTGRRACTGRGLCFRGLVSVYSAATGPVCAPLIHNLEYACRMSLPPEPLKRAVGYRRSLLGHDVILSFLVQIQGALTARWSSPARSSAAPSPPPVCCRALRRRRTQVSRDQ